MFHILIVKRVFPAESGCTYPLMKQLAKFTVGVHSSDFDKLVSYGAITIIINQSELL